MKTKIFFLILIIGLGFSSCTNDILKDEEGKAFTELPVYQQQLLNAALNDTIIARQAIVIDNKIIYYEPTKDKFITVVDYDIVLFCFIGLLLIALGIILGVAISKI
jgi:uncharacterized ferredoxin-like protein